MVTKLTLPSTENAVQSKINEIVDAIPDVSGYLQNTATGTGSLTVGGTANTNNYSVNVGISSSAAGGRSVALGNSSAASAWAIAIGASSAATQRSAIQIGRGTNSTANTLSVGFDNNSNPVNYQLLDVNGKIPLDRISVMGGATSSVNGTKGVVPAPSSGDNSKFLRGDGTWQSVSAGSGADIDLSNLSTTGQNVIDGQWVFSSQSIISGTSLSASTNLSKTVTLPNDNNIYEVLFSCRAVTGTSSGNYVTVSLSSALGGDFIRVCGARTRTSSNMYGAGSVILPLKYGTNNLIIKRDSGFTGTGDVDVIAYRRVGTNT